MARSIFWMAFGGLIFVAGFSWGQTAPSSWPTPNPVRPETQSNTGNSSAYQPNNSQANRYAAQPNNLSDNRYATPQPGTAGGTRYQGNPAANPAGGATDNRYPQLNQSTRPDQPVNPQLPTLQRRLPLQQGQPTQQTQPAAPPPPPFQLTPAEEADVNRVLTMWEQKSKDITTFDSKFVRWEYDLNFPVPNPNGGLPLANNTEQGILKYAKPDKGIYRILYTLVNEKWEPTRNERIQHWVCDGNSVFEYQYPLDPNKGGQVIEHPLPPEMKGKAIADGPLPFLFGAEADKLRKRYYFKIVPSNNPQKEVRLQAHPKFQQDAANFDEAQLILNLPEMTPKGLQLILPGRKNYSSYEFFDVVVNDKLRIFQGNPFQAYTPRGWQKVTEPAPSQNAQPLQPLQAGRPTGQAH